MIYKHAVVAAFFIYAQHGEVADKRGVGVCALNSHGNYIFDHGNHGIMFLNFCGNPVINRVKTLNILMTWFISFVG